MKRTLQLSPADGETVLAFAEALLPADGVGLPSPSEAGVVPALDRYLQFLPRDAARAVIALIRANAMAAVFTRGRRLRRVPPDAREAVVGRLLGAKGPRGVLADSLRQLILDVWASQEPVARALGYDGSCLSDAADGERVTATFLPAELRTGYRPGRAPSPRLAPVSHPDIGDGFVYRTDAIVVGSGAGGAVVAAELAEAGLRVAVLEEGAYFTSDDFTGAPFERLLRMCRDGGLTQVIGRPLIPMPLGRAVGGTTVVNSGTCFRTPRRVLDEWERDFGVEGLGPEDVDPIFDRVERAVNVTPVPWEIMGNNGLIAHRGAQALGLSGGPIPRNIVDCHGCGQCAFGCPSDAKQAMHLTYLPRAEVAGATIFSRVRVDRVLTRRGVAEGVVATALDNADRPVGRARFLAPIVVVAAGAVQTPLLLRESRLGGRSGRLGRNLRIHPATGVGGLFDDDVSAWRGTLQSYFIDTLHESHGVMLEATNSVPSVGAGTFPGIGRELAQLLSKYRNLATLGLLVSDTSTGRVRRLPGGRALVTYRMNRTDLRNVLAGLRLAAEVLLAAGARRVLVDLPGLRWADSRSDLDRIREADIRPRDLKLLAFHPMGTAHMGTDPERAVCDPWGRVYGAPGVWVSDASLFPTCLGVNPQITIMTFATRTAHAITATE
ncbi:MAG: GMC family oxidoreductase N-terminal domain-containing protein [Actinomycetota bacterium]